MNAVSCEVIRDLLPLYVDQICSEESRKLVEEHLDTCRECRQFYENLCTAIPCPVRNEKTAMVTLRKQILVIIVALAVVFACVAVNLGPAWMGGPAPLGSLCTTLLYSAVFTLLVVRTRQYRPFVRCLWAVSLVLFFSASWAVLCTFLNCGGFLSAFLGLFAAIPFYGFRMFLDWPFTYGLAAGISFVWLALTSLYRRRLDAEYG